MVVFVGVDPWPNGAQETEQHKFDVTQIHGADRNRRKLNLIKLINLIQWQKWCRWGKKVLFDSWPPRRSLSAKTGTVSSTSTSMFPIHSDNIKRCAILFLVGLKFFLPRNGSLSGKQFKMTFSLSLSLSLSFSLLLPRWTTYFTCLSCSVRQL